MADDNAKLAACPHCGKEDAFVERSDYSACHVVCNECGARGPVRCDETEADAAAYENGEAEPGEMAARRAWNTRAALPAMDREAVARIIDPTSFCDVPYTDDPIMIDMVKTWQDTALVKADAILSALSADAIRQGEGVVRDNSSDLAHIRGDLVATPASHASDGGKA